MALKKGDFVEVEYEGYINPIKKLFDTTSEKLAKEHNIFNETAKYGPAKTILGDNLILPGIDEFLVDKDLGDYELDLSPEKAFGKRNPKLIQIVPLKQFKDKGINPAPGVQFSIDGAIATIRSVTGGRVIIDFNHPLAGRSVHYKVKVIKLITDSKEKINTILELAALKNYEIKIKDKDAEIVFEKDPKSKDKLKELIEKKIPELKFKISVKPEEKPTQEQKK